MSKYLALGALAGFFLWVAMHASAATPATLTWTAVTQNTDGTAVAMPVTYNVYQGLKGVTPVKVLVASKIAGLSFLLPPLTKGSCFQMSTTDQGGDEGPLSGEVCLSLPVAPTGITFK